MPINLLVTLAISLLNVFKSVPTAASAITGLAAGAAVATNGAPSTTVDWVVLVAGAIGMVANYVVANVKPATLHQEEGGRDVG